MTSLSTHQALINIAVEELCETANSLLAPVRYGIARPTAPFTLSTSNTELMAIEDLFSSEPMTRRNSLGIPTAMRGSSGERSRRSRNRSVNHDSGSRSGGGGSRSTERQGSSGQNSMQVG